MLATLSKGLLVAFYADIALPFLVLTHSRVTGESPRHNQRQMLDDRGKRPGRAN
jgi:hypothetical protein